MNTFHSQNVENLFDSIIPNQSTHLGKHFQWDNLEDNFLQTLQANLTSFNHIIDSQHQNELCRYQQTLSQQSSRIPHIEMFRFKDIFFDFLQGQNHQAFYLGCSLQNQNIHTQIIKQMVSVLFQIAQQQKVAYPHLLTHLKEQFYKPKIFQCQTLSQSTIDKYSILIDIFFNEANLTSKYNDFIQLNPDFEQICLIVFEKIAFDEKKRNQTQGQHQLNHFGNKSFQKIQNLCSKFLIEINSFGYEKPEIQIIALANEERFVFLYESNHLFLLILEKFELLNVRRKSSHNISVYEKNEKSLRKSSQNKSLKKNSWSELDESAHFKAGQTSSNFLALNVIDSDETSNYESSILKSESKVNELSDESTPKFKHSSIAHFRKKSHKDSFGGVDFDNMVYKDLANPKRYADQKANRQKDHAKNNPLTTQVYNKKVLSERFQTNELESLTYADDQESSIEFVPHFQMNEAQEKGKSASVFGNNPTSPVYSNNTHTSFTLYATKFQMEENKYKMLQRMKGSNIQKISQFFVPQEEEHPEMIPQFKHQQSLQSQTKTHRTHSPGSRVLASSQIIEFTGSYFKQQNFRNNLHQKDDNADFLVIPSANSSKFSTVSQKNQNSNLFVSSQKDVFMSFSKNDKQKFIITDAQQNQQNQQLSPQKAERGTKDTLEPSIKENDESSDNVKTRKYSYRTQRQERQRFRSKLKFEQEAEISQTINSFISEHTPSSFAKKPKYKRYQDIHTSESIIFNQYDSASQINMNNSHTFTNQNSKDAFKLQRKHSSNIPSYRAVEPTDNNQRSRNPQTNLHSKNFQKRFQENSVRYSQVFENNENEVFYTQQKDQSRQSFGNRKQRKVTDFYERPLTNLTRGGNRASQIIQNGANTNKTNNTEHRFQGHLEVSPHNSSNLINSGGGKNYSVISNISYDEDKRIEDLLEIQNQQAQIKKHQHQQNYAFVDLSDQEIDFGNIQAIERLLLKKKQQKLKIYSQQNVVSINQKMLSPLQPKGWIKKQVFYFFEQSSLSPLRPPQKHVIMNPQKVKQKVIRENSVESQIQNRDLPSSSTSLHNYPNIMRHQNPEFEADRDKSVSNKSLGDRKYSAKQIKPVQQVNFNHSLSQMVQIQKLNSSPFISNNGARMGPVRQNKSPGQRDYDKLSIYTQPSPSSIIRLSPPRRQETVLPSMPPGPQNIKISLQHIKTYPSQPIIRFIVGTNRQTYTPPVQSQPSLGSLKVIPPQQPIQPYHIN